LEGFRVVDRYFGSHELRGRDETVQISSERSFGLVVATAFTAAGLLNLRGAGEGWPYWFGAAALFALLALVAPRVLAPLNRIWATFGLLLHRLISPVILAVLFYGCITPIGLLMRLTGKDPLRRRFEREAQSYWIARAPDADDLASFNHQF
jgi:saxitoxin biosynthesis operon SxtJ-like protein